MKIRNLIYIILLAAGVAACGPETPDEILPPTSEGRLTLEVSSESPLLKIESETANEGSVQLRSKGGELAIDVLTNQASWSYEAKDAHWLSLSADDYFLYISAEANPDQESRKAEIVISAARENERAEFTLHISQNHSGVPEIALAANSLRMEAHTSLTQTIAVETNCDEWDFDCTCPWLLIEKGDQGLTLTADDNTYNAQRETTIKVVGRGLAESAEDILTVKQDGNAFIVLTSHNVTADDMGATKTIVVSSNPELEWDFEAEESNWFEAVRGQEENTLVVTINPNEAGLERFGKIHINVGDENNNASATLSVHQIGTDTDELIYEVEISEPDFLLTAAPVLTLSTGGTITVDWGDGSEIEVFDSKRGTHLYKQPGLYTITISGEAHQLKFSDGDNLCPELKNVISWGKLGYRNAADMCLGCSNLESIPNDVAGSFADVKSFLGAFSCCESLKKIPEGLFRYATLAKNFEECFSHSASIEEIPAGLFSNCKAAERFIKTFYGTGSGYVITTSTLPNFEELKTLVGAGKLKSIPAELFANCPNALRFDYVLGATAITEIPEELFKNNSAATIFTGAFSACVNLEKIPQGILNGAKSATDIKYMFAGCDSVEEIPSGMFTNNTAITNLEYIFYKTGVKRLQKGIFEGLPNVKTIGAVFQDCTQLSEIEAGVFNGLTAAKSFKYCFSGCTSLRSIPEELFAGLTAAYEFKSTFEDTALESIPAGLFADARDYSSADFTYMLAGCKELKTVPAELFEKFTTVTSPGFSYAFFKSGIETIPAGLFAKNVNVSTGFENVFDTCTNLTTIEGSIFPYSSNVSSLAYAFADCTSLKSLPADLFVPLAESQTKYTATFYGCTSLESLPAGLFAQNKVAKQFSSTFLGCSSLTSIPADLLGSKEKVTTVKGMFEGCTSLTSIPAELFSQAPAITSFERTFALCSSLTTLPAELFAAIGTKTSSITFSQCFTKCTSLQSLPAELFDTVRRISYIDGCFDGCSSLAGESPYTIITDESGVESKIHLYERTKGTEFPIVSSSSSAHADCFAGCTKLSDYGTMPASWK